ncbi:MAG: ABC transporter permease [Thermomicrobiales bacterium]|nr:ABC transporter permease [Thermomicrobiales bacterium]MCO5218523.1 ABC transporter permease [Thermomicrobiales bacterium]MCO5224811.1 ABC transporter permease [Thermomicrobiales bacterium]
MDRPITFMDELLIARRIIAIRLRGQMAYRSSFLLQIFANFLINTAEVLALFAMFYQFDSMGGWTLGEVALLHGMSMIAFSLGDMLTIGMDYVAPQIRSGEFDRVLTRPLSSWMNAVTSEINLRHLGQLIQGFLVLTFAFTQVNIDWSVTKVLMLIGAILTGVALFMALFTVEAIFSFWTVNGVEAINAFTYGGSDLAQFPMHVFGRTLRVLFIWIIPVAFVTYYPALYLLDKPDPLGMPGWFVLLGPVITAVFCGVVAWGWNQGIRHYRSTGS